MRRRLPLGISAGLVLAAAGGCAGAGLDAPEPAPYRPDRREYRAFRAAHPEVLDPNYLPFMVHRIPDDGPAGDLLVFCRFGREDMPLGVSVETPEIPDALQDEFRPRDPQDYVRAVREALDMWEAQLEGLVTFRHAERADAELSFALVGEPAPAPHPDLRVLGSARLRGACRRHDAAREENRIPVRFEIGPVHIYLADQHGLLSPDQVEWIALHEIGHALGMRGHSPIPADLMYSVVRDRVSVTEPSAEDVNSFVSLYTLPNGALYGHVPPEGSDPRPPPMPPTGAPLLSISPYVDARRGFELRTPAGWLRLETRRGMVAVDGLTWDYTASFQVIVERFPTIEAYLRRFGMHYLRRGRIRYAADVVVNGRPAFQAEIVSRDGSTAEEVTLIEVGDGRVLVVIADCPAGLLASYRPWFRAALATLEF